MTKLLYIFLVAYGVCCAVGRVEAAESEVVLEQLKQRVQVVRLSNGLRVVLYKRQWAPVFSGVVTIGVGGADEQPGHTGSSHLFEHMAFKGTSTVGTKDYSQEAPLLAELEGLMASAGGSWEALSDEGKSRWAEIQDKLVKLWDVASLSEEYQRRGAVGLNASTSTDLTRYYVSAPRSAFEFWCWMESERLIRPVMRQFYRERDVVLEERRMRFEDSPSGKLYERFLNVAFLEHPYRLPVIGYEVDVARLTAGKVEEFRREYYVPDNIVVSIVGAVDLEQDRLTLERYFGRLPTGPSPARPRLVEPPQTGERRIELKLQAAPELVVGYHKPVYPHPDDALLTLASEILAGSRVSPLHEQLVQKEKVAVSVSSFEAPGQRYPNLLAFHIVPRAPYASSEVLRVFDQVLKRSQNITNEQVVMAQKAIVVEYLRELQSNTALAKNLGSAELLYGDWRAVLTWLDQVQAADAATVSRALLQYLRPDKRTIAYISSKGRR